MFEQMRKLPSCKQDKQEGAVEQFPLLFFRFLRRRLRHRRKLWALVTGTVLTPLRRAISRSLV